MWDCDVFLWNSCLEMVRLKVKYFLLHTLQRLRNFSLKTFVRKLFSISHTHTCPPSPLCSALFCSPTPVLLLWASDSVAAFVKEGNIPLSLVILSFPEQLYFTLTVIRVDSELRGNQVLFSCAYGHFHLCEAENSLTVFLETGFTQLPQLCCFNSICRKVKLSMGPMYCSWARPILATESLLQGVVVP